MYLSYGIYSEKDLGPLANYIDYERYGRDIAMDEQGRFTDEGYVRVASERWDRQFDGELDDIPDEYRITGSGEAAERDSTIAVLVVEPGKEPYVCLLYTSIMSSPVDRTRVWFAALHGLVCVQSIVTAKSRQSANTMPHSRRTL